MLIVANVIRCSRLRFSVGLFDVFNVFFFSSKKEINRLISKGMSNIYLKVIIQKIF